MADTPDIDEQITLMHKAAITAPDKLPEAIANHLRCDYEEWYRLCQIDHSAPAPIIASARAVLALPVPAPAVDREGLAEQAYQIAYDAVDWNDTIRWVTPGPGEAAWTDVGTLRVQADEIVKQAVDALISAGLVRAVDTAQDGSEHRG